MTRRWLAAALIVATAAIVSAQPAQPAQIEQQRGLVQSLLDLAVKEKIEGTTKRLQELMQELQLGKPLSQPRQIQILREVEDKLKPVPIVKGSLAPQLTQSPISQYQALTPAQETGLLDAAASVAQIEIASTSGLVARGTGFVVGAGLIATNCHVLAQIATQAADGTWQLRAGVRAHFADGPEHDDAKEFLVTAIAAMPTARGLDVAILKVNTVSVDGQGKLPKKLTLRSTTLNPAPWLPGQGLPIALIGYPRINSSTETNYVELRKRGKFAKIFSPGRVMDLSTIQSIDILNHIAGTTEGSSGSPLFSIDTFEVIGVHSCCTAAGTPATATTMPCAEFLKAAADSNHAIASWSILSNEHLKKLF